MKKQNFDSDKNIRTIDILKYQKKIKKKAESKR